MTVGALPVQAVLAARLTSVTLAACPYCHQAQTVSGTATLTAIDDTAANLGWKVTAQSSTLACTGTHNGAAIPAASHVVASSRRRSPQSSQAVDPTGGPKMPAVSPAGSLDTPRKIAQAFPGHGKGTNNQQVGLALVLLGHQRRWEPTP